jgi:hypothetical protein
MNYPIHPRFFVGVDPGLTGGIVVLDEEGSVLGKSPMPRREDGSIDSGRLTLCVPSKCKSLPHEIFLTVEKVWAFKSQGVSSTFTFGKVTGVAIGALESFLGTRAYEVSPQTWQRNLWSNVEDPKEAAREFVAGNWPEESFLATSRSKKPHQGMVDAACLAEWSRRNWRIVVE